MEVEFVGEPGSPGTPLRNRSTFMVNVGTHKLPESLHDYALLLESLVKTLKRILSQDGIEERILFRIEKTESGRLNKLSGHGIRLLEKPKARFTVERGDVTGRIDAHILMDFVHDTKIQFDTKGFQRILDDELEVENRRFLREEVRSNNSGKILKWAKPKSYVSVRLIGSIMAVDAERYIAKHYRPNTEVQSERKLRDLLRNDIRVGESGGTVGSSSSSRSGDLQMILN